MLIHYASSAERPSGVGHQKWVLLNESDVKVIQNSNAVDQDRDS